MQVTRVSSAGISLRASDDLYLSFSKTGGAGNLSDPMTNRDDIIIRNASNSSDWLPVGASNRVLISDGTEPSNGQIPLASSVSWEMPMPNGGTGSTSAADARTALGAEAAGSNILKADTADVLTAGYAATPFS